MYRPYQTARCPASTGSRERLCHSPRSWPPPRTRRQGVLEWQRGPLLPRVGGDAVGQVFRPAHAGRERAVRPHVHRAAGPVPIAGQLGSHRPGIGRGPLSPLGEGGVAVGHVRLTKVHDGRAHVQVADAGPAQVAIPEEGCVPGVLGQGVGGPGRARTRRKKRLDMASLRLGGVGSVPRIGSRRTAGGVRPDRRASRGSADFVGCLTRRKGAPCPSSNACGPSS